MPDWLKELIVAIGGGTVVLIGVLTIFKSLLIKLFETGIESSFEKSIEKFRNQLSRSTRAYEIMLDKEFGYYSALDPYLARLVPLVQDLVYYSNMSEELEPSIREEHFKENLIAFLNMIPEMKNDVVLFQPYIPEQVFIAVSNLIGEMQKDLNFWNDTKNVIFGMTEEKVDLQKAQNIRDTLLLCIASIEIAIKKRLTQLTQ